MEKDAKEKLVFLIDKLKEFAEILPDGCYQRLNFKAEIKAGKYHFFDKSIDMGEIRHTVRARFSPEGLIRFVEFSQWDGKKEDIVRGDFGKGIFVNEVREHLFSEKGEPVITVISTQKDTCSAQTCDGYSLSVASLKFARNERIVKGGLLVAALLAVGLSQVKCDSNGVYMPDVSFPLGSVLPVKDKGETQQAVVSVREAPAGVRPVCTHSNKHIATVAQNIYQKS